jgi:pyruvate dehydrogenase E2 component (dihydrolipoamide acetyltransferase)
MPDVRMPRLSDSMEEGTILRWLKQAGDHVDRGEELVEIETDKATMVYEADASGRLEILVQEGETVPLGHAIAVIGERAAGVAPAAEEAPPAEPDRPPVDASPGGGASPVARRMAASLGIDLQSVAGSGPRGRVLKADVRASAPAMGAVTQSPAPAAPAAAPSRVAAVPPAETDPSTAKGAVTVQEPSRTQRLIARRMAESKATIPEFTLSTDVDMEGCVELRAQLKSVAAEDRPAPSYNDMVLKACALALREHPRANGSYRDGVFELFSRVNVGMAVAAQDALVVPTVDDADAKSLGHIARETRRLAERVRSGTVTPAELSGGTFTVSNLGMYGITGFTAVINPPQAAILAVGQLGPRAVVRDGAVEVRATMTVTLTCDHRILYGADAAQFLARIRELLERPLALAL